MTEYSNTTVDFERFKQVLGEFFKGRFEPTDCKNIWKKRGWRTGGA